MKLKLWFGNLSLRRCPKDMPGASDAGETRRDCGQVHALLWSPIQAGVQLGVGFWLGGWGSK